jgi:hypothetical protein
MDGPREQEVKWSKPGSERQSLHAFSYLWKIDPNINKNIIVHIKKNHFGSDSLS